MREFDNKGIYERNRFAGSSRRTRVIDNRRTVESNSIRAISFVVYGTSGQGKRKTRVHRYVEMLFAITDRNAIVRFFFSRAPWNKSSTDKHGVRPSKTSSPVFDNEEVYNRRRGFVDSCVHQRLHRTHARTGFESRSILSLPGRVNINELGRNGEEERNGN